MTLVCSIGYRGWLVLLSQQGAFGWALPVLMQRGVDGELPTGHHGNIDQKRLLSQTDMYLAENAQQGASYLPRWAGSMVISAPGWVGIISTKCVIRVGRAH